MAFRMISLSLVDWLAPTPPTPSRLLKIAAKSPTPMGPERDAREMQQAECHVGNVWVEFHENGFGLISQDVEKMPICQTNQTNGWLSRPDSENVPRRSLGCGISRKHAASTGSLSAVWR